MHYLQDAVELLLKKKLTISICESCTGGMLGSMLTAIPGSSHYFYGGIIAYANTVKQKVVGVSLKTLKRYGAVSAQVARAMAQSVRREFKTDLAIAITGIAGPSGGTSKKPVGTVYICIVIKELAYTEHYLLRGSRSQIKKAACSRALKYLRTLLAKNRI